MSNTEKKQTRFKTVLPMMIYVDPDQPRKIKAFAKANNLSASQLAREAFTMRMSGTDDPYNNGFNAGLKEAMRITKQTEGAKMMFPSGKSFGQLVCDEINKFIREKKGELK